MKPHVYRVGDKVRVVNPRWVRRVGYPIVWTEIEPEVREMERTKNAWLVFRGRPLGFAEQLNIPLEFVKACAKQVVIERGFGGDRREIYYDDPVAPAEGGSPVYWGYGRNPGQILTVQSKRIVHTGVRVPAYGDGDDYVDGFLDERKVHMLLTLESGEIEACDVELVA